MRLPDLTPAELDEAQRVLRSRIVGGPRGSGPQHFPLEHADGSLTGPFGVMLHEPALGAPLQELGSAIRYASGLSAHAFCLRLLDDAGPAACLDDDTYATYAAVLGTTTMTELVVLVGYYRTLAQLLDVFDVGVPGDQ